MPATHYITIDKFCEESGYTPDAVRSKIKRGDWLPGKEFIKAPDGIPGEMLVLGAALKPLNDRIKSNVEIIGFSGNVHITDDMTIMEDDGKLYSFSSKATRLLIDSMIAEAISHVSGIKFFMIDEFDLLDLKSRSAYLKWLITLARSGEVDSVLLFGTLKEKPAGLPPEVAAHWVVGGVLGGAGLNNEEAA